MRFLDTDVMVDVHRNYQPAIDWLDSLEEIPGIPAEFVLRNDAGLTVRANGALIQKRGATISISKAPTGFGHVINLRTGTGSAIQLILLSQKEAENSWKAEIDGSLHLVETDQDFFADGKAFTLQSQEPQCEFNLFPTVAGDLRLVGGRLSVQGDGESRRYAGSVPEAHTEFKIEKIKDAGEVPSVKFGPALSWRPVGVAMAPQDSDFGTAAKGLLHLGAADPLHGLPAERAGARPGTPWVRALACAILPASTQPSPGIT